MTPPEDLFGVAEPVGSGHRAHAIIDHLIRRGLVALIAIVLLAGTAAALMHGAVSSLDHTAEVINLSGRQRMLTQRAALFATRIGATDEIERMVHQSELRAVIDNITRAQTLLTDSPEILPEVRELYATIWLPENGILRRYVDALQPFLTPSPPRNLPVPRVDEVLATLDGMTGRVVGLVNATVQRSWLLSLIVFGVIAGTAVIMIPFAILPPARLVHRQVDDMAAIAARLALARTEADEANRAKSGFLSRMSHELRTPLNAILGFGQLMQSSAATPLTPQQATCVEHILSAGDHLLQLINDILDLAKIEAGKIQLSLENVYLETVVQECLTMTGAMAAKHRIQVLVGQGPEPDMAVTADHMRLRQVVLNLISNAIKYNRTGGTVTLSCGRAPDGRLRLTVADTGHGIPEAQRDMLFRPFTRLDAEYKDIEGTGIGLTITKQLVEMMGGTIDYVTAEGKGTTFWVDLPGSASAEHPAPSTETAADKGMGTILYIEDNPANIQLLKMIVSQIGPFTLLTAHTAELGLELAEAHAPQLIFMDLNLPGMDGFEVLQRLKANPATHDIPVVALTADATKRSIQRGEAAGFQQYLNKPIDVERVTEVIRTIMTA